jgi:hypothetical protein
MAIYTCLWIALPKYFAIFLHGFLIFVLDDNFLKSVSQHRVHLRKTLIYKPYYESKIYVCII